MALQPRPCLSLLFRSLHITAATPTHSRIQCVRVLSTNANCLAQRQQRQRYQEQQRHLQNRTRGQSFHLSSVMGVSQESQLNKDNGKRAEEAEKHKQEQLQKAMKEGKGQWKEELASEGERSVAADRNTEADPETLQKQTQGEVTKKHGQK